MEFVFLSLGALAALGLLGFTSYKLSRSKTVTPVPLQGRETEPDYKISYARSDKQWSGSSSSALPLKTLTYKQYECLEDARYGFKIIGVTPTGRKEAQPHKIRPHGQKTVASLIKHGFLAANDDDTCVITDHGLNALAVCDVRY